MYDDVDWHSGGEGLPADVGPGGAATHIGVFLAWAVLEGHASADLLRDATDEVVGLRARAATGARLVLARGGALTDADLDDDAAAFAAAYYTGDEDDPDGAGLYLEDYVDAASPDAGDPEDVYRVPDTWETYDLVGPLISARFSQWEDEGRPAVLRQRG
ncbi:hypothetical protein [Cellulosimicrobium arenosum]|uniref:DUF7832 domain-containing protein n=1 Tax=Cellulosimicrobium arenosum TaxID=2708133 RepID=A0A927G8A6_9MICO|nr:hypothetical protein [Cellulosimicrobium arenosum]MBD8078782.1 hypothetical protein [Cellulosimicrobium arenosum]